MAKKYRRAKGLYRLRLLSMYWYGFIFFVSIAAFMLIFSHAQPERMNNFKIGIISFLQPALEILSTPTQAVEGFSTNIDNWVNAKEQNEEMREEIADLRTKISTLEQLKRENKALRTLHRREENDDPQYITAARIIMDSSWQFYRTVLVNVGSDKGVKTDMYVTGNTALVGRVIEVGKNYSRVLLLQDWASRIPVVIGNTNVRAIAAGRNSLALDLIHLTGGETSELKSNMIVMTSGRGGVFSPAIPIGRLKINEENQFFLVPYSDTSKMTFLKIYKGQKPKDVE